MNEEIHGEFQKSGNSQEKHYKTAASAVANIESADSGSGTSHNSHSITI